MLERLAILLGTTLAHHRTERALVERVKELTCLHAIARATARRDAELSAILQEVGTLLPPAWQYPDTARARIVLDGQAYGSPDFTDGWPRQSAAIIVRGLPRGTVEVGYAEPRPSADEGPFLREERALIDSVAQELSALVEQRTSEEERARLQEQLRHADRLVTIGQLSAGVAHELNEPLMCIWPLRKVTLPSAEKIDAAVVRAHWSATAAVGHVVVEDAVGPGHVDGLRQRKRRGIFHHAAGVARGELNVHDDGVVRVRGVDLAEEVAAQ